MKLTAYAAMILAAGALAGSAMAQATMQPIPNPPEGAGATHHGKMAWRHKMARHHKMAKHHKAMKADMAADSAATPK